MFFSFKRNTFKKKLTISPISDNINSQFNVVVAEWQTRTFEGRMVYPCEFKSHRPHQNIDFLSIFFLSKPRKGD